MKQLIQYSTGFVISVALTLAAYFAVINHAFPNNGIIAFIIGLAVVQLITQMLFFLHLGEETGARHNLFSFLFTVSIVVILVGGSLWIMYHLNTNMTPQEMQDYIMNQDAL